MALVIIQSSRLSKDQKKRIGEMIIDGFHREGIPASSVVVLFQRETQDILLEGGLFVEAPGDEPATAPAPERRAEAAVPSQPLPAPQPDYKSKARRNRSELADLRARLVKTLQTEGALTSFQAQEQLGLKECDWAPATLRRFFSELEEEGVITKQGQKRGTRYLWKGLVVQPAPKVAQAKLVKRTELGEPVPDGDTGLDQDQ